MEHDRQRVPDLTVVVASIEAERSIERCLSSIEAACNGLRAEIIVVDASRDSTAQLVAAGWPALEVIRYPPGTLVPALWAAGFRASRSGPVVFTIGHVVVPSSWARALLEGLRDADGVGGPLLLADASGPVDWAVFYLRYTAFLPRQLTEGLVNGEIAGDNAAYRRQALERESLSDGFWEVEFHRSLRRGGGRLAARSGAAVQFTYSAPFRSIARHRFDHGRHFGAKRVAHGASRLRVAAAAPVVPFVLALRAARRVLPERGYRARFVAALPIFVVLASAWAAGEAVGALSAGRSP
jgi:hypothetical protein